MKPQEIISRIGYAATLSEESFFTAVDFAKKKGFSAIEINLNVPIFFPEKYSPEERKAIKEKVEREEMTLSFHAPEDIPLYHLHPIVRRAGLERLKECIDFAAEVGGSKITFHPGASVCFTQTDEKIYLQEVYRDDFKDLFKAALEEIRDYAKGKILPCIENVGNYNEMIRETLDELLPQGDLYLTWDIGHSYGQQENQEFLRKNLKYVKNCHIHDHNGESDHQVIGTGKIDFLNYFHLLKDHDTSFILEVRPVKKALESQMNIKKMLFRMKENT